MSLKRKWQKGESGILGIFVGIIAFIVILVFVIPAFAPLFQEQSNTTIDSALSYLLDNGYVAYSDSDGDWEVSGDAIISGNLTAETGRTATYVVAASDAPAHVKAQADYVWDGTGDATTEVIQPAIDALPATGGDLFFYGHFVGSKMQVSTDGVGFFGLGAGELSNTGTAFTLADGVNDYILEVSKAGGCIDNFRMSNIYFDGNKANNPTGKSCVLTKVYRSRFDNCWFFDAKENGCEIQGVAGGNPAYAVTNRFIGCHAGLNGGDGFKCSGDYVGDSFFLICESVSEGAGYHLVGVGYRIIHCWAEQVSGFNMDNAIVIEGRSAEGTYGNWIDGCHLGHVDEDIIVITSDYDCTDIHITNNKIASTSLDGNGLYNAIKLNLASGKTLKNSFITRNDFEQEIAQTADYVLNISHGEADSLVNTFLDHNVIASLSTKYTGLINQATQNYALIEDNLTN